MFVNNFVNRLTEFIQPLEIVYIAKILNDAFRFFIMKNTLECYSAIKISKDIDEKSDIQHQILMYRHI